MRPKKYYEVPPEAFLFSSKDKVSDHEEEKIRQWCAHELIRAYGASVLDLGFEAKVQVGSKTYRIDILVSRNGKPWIAVECKRRTHSKHEAAMQQAISYADVQTEKPEFAVYTNGSVWQVQRRIGARWIPVTDLPVIDTPKAARDMVSHLRVLRDVQPLLRMLDEEVKGREALRFLRAMERFFNGSHSWVFANDTGLLDAADHLLRVLGEPPDDLVYRFGKLAVAANRLQDFGARTGLSFVELNTRTDTSANKEMRVLHAQLLNGFPSADEIEGADALLLKLIVSLLEYGKELPARVSKYPLVPASLHTSPRAYLDAVLLIHFELKLPEQHDDLLTADLRGYCDEAWKPFDLKRIWIQFLSAMGF